ncbi:MAG: outer membrane protein assembly factor BamB family protein [Methanobacteriota archaeon]
MDYEDFVTVAYDAESMRLVWSKLYDGPNHQEDGARGVVLSPDGSMAYVAGDSDDPGQGIDALVFAYDVATGEKNWGFRYDFTAPNAAFGLTSDEEIHAVAISPDGRTLFVTGGRLDLSSNTGYDTLTAAIDTKSGRLLWESTLSIGGLGTRDEGVVIAATPDGQSVIVGASGRIISYSASMGVVQWTAPISRFEPEAIVVEPNGTRAYLSGDLVTVALDLYTGRQVWMQAFEGAPYPSDEADSIAIDPAKRLVYVTGLREVPSDDVESVTIAYRADTGGQVWVSRWNAPGNDLGEPARLGYRPAMKKMGVTPDGTRVIVVTTSSGLISTFALKASDGAQLWESRYGEPATWTGLARGLVLSEDGERAFVCGMLGHDFVILRYDTATGNIVPR